MDLEEGISYIRKIGYIIHILNRCEEYFQKTNCMYLKKIVLVTVYIFFLKDPSFKLLEWKSDVA